MNPVAKEIIENSNFYPFNWRCDHNYDEENPEIDFYPYDYYYLIINDSGFVIGDFETFVRYRGAHDIFEVCTTLEEAQRAAYDHVRNHVREFLNNVPTTFPTGKQVYFEQPRLIATIA